MYQDYLLAYNLKNLWKCVKNVVRPKPSMIPDYFPYSHVYCWDHSTEVIFDFPYNPILRNRIVDSFLQCGWRIAHRRLMKGNDQLTLTHDMETMDIRLDFEASTEGSVCQKVLLGYETVTREEPIYDLVCEEGAEENVLDASH